MSFFMITSSDAVSDATDLTPSWQAIPKFMSLDCSFTVLWHTCFAVGSPLLSCSDSVDAIAWSFQILSMLCQMVGWASLISLAKALFQPSNTLLVQDQFVSVMSWTFQSSGVNVAGGWCILMGITSVNLLWDGNAPAQLYHIQLSVQSDCTVPPINDFVFNEILK